LLTMLHQQKLRVLLSTEVEHGLRASESQVVAAENGPALCAGASDRSFSVSELNFGYIGGPDHAVLI
jgi:hypothetical protein